MTAGIRAILWDNDGVLVDTEPLYFRANREVLAGVGAELTEAEFVSTFLVHSTGAWHLAVERGIPEADIPRLKARRNELYARLLAEGDTVLPGVRETLAALRGRFRMGIVTSSRREHFDIIHRSAGLLPFFDFVLTSEDFTRHKPDPEPYLLGAAAAGFDPSECLAVEDSERGLRSAAAAGVRCVAIPRGLSRSGDFGPAWRVLKDIRELPAVLEAPMGD